MKRIPMILLLLAPYALVVAIMCSSENYKYLKVGFVLYLFILLINLVYALFSSRFGVETKQILFWNMLLKLCNVPLYLFVFFVVLLINVMAIPAIPFLVVMEYLLLLSSSAYGIRGLTICYKEKEISLGTLIVNLIAHLMFCTDVFSSVYCYNKIRKLKIENRQLLEKPDWETVVELMYDKQLDCFDDEVIRVIYSKDKSKRYLILKKKNGILTYLLEYVYQFDDEEWNYISNQENALPAMWEPYYTDWGVSHFEKEEELMNELIYEPEYKQFFS